MNEITRNIWIGDLRSALNIQQLRDNNIQSVLSVMRGKLKINETFIRHQIQLDDTHEADILSQFLPAIHFIGGELEKGRGVLVHCQAGISRSPTIVAAYLIYTLNITPDEALGIILKQRPFVQPNENFSRQLDLFHSSQGNTSKTGERAASTSLRQRRIRCKMCRLDLATREHILDHGRQGSSAQKPSDCRPQVDSSPSEASDHHNSGATTSQGIGTGSSKASTLPNSADASNIEDIKVATSQLRLIGQQSSDSTLAANCKLATTPDSVEQPPLTTTTITRLKGLLDPATEYSKHLPSESNQQDSHHLPIPRPPSLIDPKCSGYFVEPMKWMDHFLSAGSLSGKITCPNKKCNAKLGNYDWAGVCCGCKTWVTPGFCINRSKVDMCC